MDSVQTYLAQHLTAYLSEELGAKVDVQHVSVELFSEVKLKEFYIEDLYGDTLLYADQILLSAENFDYGDRSIDLNLLKLTNAVIIIGKKKGIPGTTLDFLIDYFNKAPSETDKQKKFSANLQSVQLENSTFSFYNESAKEKEKEFDFKNMDFHRLNGTFTNLQLGSDSVVFNIQDLSFAERKGFVVDELSALATISSLGMSFDELLLVTPHSKIDGRYAMHYSDIDDLDNFVEDVRMEIEFAQSEISSKDIASFSHPLTGLDKVVELNGRISGSVSSFKGKDLKLTYDDNTYFEGNVSLVGLPDIKETFIDLQVKKLTTHSDHVQNLPVAPFKSKRTLEVPEVLQRLGSIYFAGNFTGFYNDFVAYGKFSTDLGQASSDINLKIREQSSASSYSGNFQTTDFDLGALLENKNLGTVSFDLAMSGKGFTLSNATSVAEGKIHHIEVNGYDYKNVTVDGELGTQLFTGQLNIDNDDLNLDFNGTVDFTHAQPVLDFRATVDSAFLSRLNLVQRDSMPILSTTAELKVTGFNLDSVFGTMNFYHTTYSEGLKSLSVDTLKIRVSEFNSLRFLTVSSDFIDAEVRGIFKISKAGMAMAQMLSRYFPMIDFAGDTIREKQSFDYEINIKESDLITEIFLPELSVAPNTYLFGKCDNWSDNLTFILRSKEVTYDRFTAGELSVNSKNIEGNLLINTVIGRLALNDSAMLNDITIDSKTNRDKGTFAVRYTDSDTATSVMHLKTAITFATRDNPAIIKILPSRMIVNGERWRVDPENQISYRKQNVQFQNMTFTSANHSLSIQGFMSDSIRKPLRLVLKNYDISLLNNYLAVVNLRLGGIVNGTVDLRQIFDTPNFSANLHVDDFVLFNDTLGNAELNSDWNASTNTITVKSSIDRGSKKNIEIDGDYRIVERGEDVMNFDIQVDKMYLQTLGHYVQVVFSDLKGLVSGNLNLAGNFSKPLITGKLNFQKASFKFDYLNTYYNFSHEVEFLENSVSLNGLKLNDVNGRQAVIEGGIIHNRFSELIFDLDIEANNFNALNTTSTQNDLFYGTAFATGNVSVKGKPDYLLLRIAVKTEENTRIYIPLYYPEEIGSSGFVQFINTGVKSKVEDDLQDRKITGLDMVFDFEVTPDAEIQLIFDPKIGDLIRGSGNGNIRMEIDPTGKFDMYGDYRVTSGDYLFTLQNVINKKFVLKPGGVIRWSGSPYSADVDISAIYKLRASLFDLIRDTTGSFRKRIPVEVHLNLREDLFNPKIDFDIEIPDIDPTVQTQVNRYISTEQEKSEQAFSLLVLNRFATPQELQNKPNFDAGSSVSANASELLSNQLSQWASQISSNFDLGLNYRAGTAISREELEVAMSTTLFNDRVLIDGNLGVNDNNNTSNLVGDFKVEVKLTEEGKIRLKAYNKANNSTLLTNLNSQYTQGIGIFYREEFNSLGELFGGKKAK